MTGASKHTYHIHVSWRLVAGRTYWEASLGLARAVATLLFVISIPIVLATTNTRLLASEGRVYDYAIDEYDAEATTGIAREELVDASEELREYFNNEIKTLYVRAHEGGREVSLFNPRETAHLRDVKDLFQLTFRVQELLLIYALVYVVGVFVWARERSLRSLARQTLTAGLVTAGVILGLGAFAVTGFDQAFEQFHLISFENELWKLDPRTDHLIQMFPEDFWFDVTMMAGVMTLVEAGLLVVAGAVYLGLTRGQDMPALEPSGQGA